MIESKIRRKSSRDVDESFLAGWMYADLFLALMVVFLATVTFIPEYLGRLDQSATNSAFVYQEIYKEPMVVVYEGFDGNLIKRDINAFLKSERLTNDSKIIYVQVVGSYDPKMEDRIVAIERAQQFSKKLDLFLVDYFANPSTTLSTTTSIPKNRVVVKFTFATTVGVKSNP